MLNQIVAGAGLVPGWRSAHVRDDAEAAIAREAYDLVTLDIELGRERHAGVAIINAINKTGRGTPVLVVSAMPAAIYRSIMKALDAWDYLQKTAFEEADFVETFLEILRESRDKKPVAIAQDTAAAFMRRVARIEIERCPRCHGGWRAIAQLAPQRTTLWPRAGRPLTAAQPQAP